MLKLPLRPEGKDAIEYELDSFNSIVLLGANGSGKTRMSVWLEENIENLHRISAQKSLTIPRNVFTNTIKDAEQRFRYGITDEDDEIARRVRFRSRWDSNPATHLLNDFKSLLELLYTEEFDKHMQGEVGSSEKSKLDIIKEIWEDIFPHRKLNKRAGYIEVSLTSNPEVKYNSSEMSDGERLTFYFIGAVLCANKDATIIIDEPENHLHSSIINKLWDKIEPYRTDCKFIYLTHDIDFAITRNEAKLIWIKNYMGNDVWDYEDVTNLEIPKDIYLDIMGSRSPIIFVEGNDTSLDYRLYQAIYVDYDVVPLNSCSKVIEVTKSLRHMESYHFIEAYGIIDRDRRSSEELEALIHHGIFSLGVSEVENLFLVEEIIKYIAEKNLYDAEDVFNQYKQKVIELFEGNLEKEVYDHVRYQLSNKIINRLNGRLKTKEEYIQMLNNIASSAEENISLFETKYSEFLGYIKQQDYNSILKVINYKDLIRQASLDEALGVTKNGYYDKIIKILKKNDEESERLKDIFQMYINFR